MRIDRILGKISILFPLIILLPLKAEAFYNAQVTAHVTPTGKGKVYVADGASSFIAEDSSISWETDTSTGGNGSNSPGAVSVFIYAFPNDGYKFDGWSDTADGAIIDIDTFEAYQKSGRYIKRSYQASVGTATYNIWARFSTMPYFITYEPGNHSTGGSTSAKQYNIEQGFSLASNGFTPEAGWLFDKWEVKEVTSDKGNWIPGDKYEEGESIADKFGDVTLTALWKEKPKGDITIEISGLRSGDSAIFAITKNGQPYGSVALTGNGSGTVSTTLKNQETGVQYTVTPTSWSWTYTGDGPGGAWPSHAFNLGNSGYTCSFTAVPQTARNHDEKSAVNFR